MLSGEPTTGYGNRSRPYRSLNGVIAKTRIAAKMNQLSTSARLALTLLCLAPAFPLRAAEGTAKVEIDYLLKYIESADCRFIRSGTEYSPKEATAHLRMKLDKAGNRVKTAEDFITGIASKSYLNGKPYQIKLAN